MGGELLTKFDSNGRESNCLADNRFCTPQKQRIIAIPVVLTGAWG
jgi:hypothetical protein